MSVDKLRQRAAEQRNGGEEEPSATILPFRSQRVKDIIEPLVEHPEPIKQYPLQTSKFTPETVEVIIKAVAAGNYFTTAAALAGISVDTIYRWLRWGQEEERPGYKEFYEAIMAAEAEAEAGLVHVVRAHAELDWRAGMDILSRRFAEHWSQKGKMELSGANGGPVEITVAYDDGE